MNDYTDRILELLKGHTQHKPLRGDDLVAQLRNLDPDTLDAMLDDLQGRGALCRAEITKNGHTYTALWPTGLVPRALSWKYERNNGKGLMGGQLAHNVQQAAEQSRQPIPHHSSPITEEKPMTRIARPAQIVEKVHETNRPHNLTRNTGTVQQAILEVLRDGGLMDVESIFSNCPVKTSLGSVGKTLETLAKRGTVVVSLKFHNHRNRRFYNLPGFVPDTTDPETAADAGKLIDPADVQPEVFEGDAPITRAAAVADLESDSTRFALWDNGSLLITVGDEIIALPKPEAQRLATYLHGCAGVLFAEAA